MDPVGNYNNVYTTVIPSPVDTGLMQYTTTGSLVSAFQPSLTQLQSGIIASRAPTTLVRPMRIHGKPSCIFISIMFQVVIPLFARNC